MDEVGLIQLAVHGDERALRNLVDFVQPIIHTRVLRVLARTAPRGAQRDLRQEVEDLTQEVYGALFAHGGRVLLAWDPQRGLSLKNFVGLVAEREVTSILRTGNRNPWREDPTIDGELAEQVGPDNSVEGTLEARQLLEVLLDELRMKLSPQGMQLFKLLEVEGRTVEEVSAMVGMSHDALYAWRSRLGKLVRTLAQKSLSDSRAPHRNPLVQVLTVSGKEA